MRVLSILLILIIIGCSNQKKEVKQGENKSTFEKYDEYSWTAMLQYKKQEFGKSLENFQKALKILPELNLNENQTAKDLIIKSIQKTNTSENYFDNFKEFDAFRDKELFNEIKTEYSKFQSQFYAGLENPEIYNEIEDLIKRDQEVRKNGSKPEEMRKIDSLNITRLIEINKEYGWQKKQWILLWHHRGIHREDNHIWNFFRPFINRQIEDGKIRKDFWAMFDEEKLITDKGVQMYGLYTNNFEQFPLQNVEKVDSLRATIGKPPLWYESEVYGITLPNGYKKTAPNNTYSK